MGRIRTFYGSMVGKKVVMGVTGVIGIGFVISLVAWVIGTVFGIIAGIKASNNEPYNYPLSVQMIK